MKVIFCLKYFLPGHVAGTEVYVDALCRNLQQTGVDVLVVKPSYTDTVITEYYHEGIRVIEYPETSAVTKELQTGRAYPEGIRIFREIILKEQPDIVHFHEITGSNGITIQHLRVVKELGIKVYTTLHLAGYVCKTATLRYKGKEKCDGVISATKCSVCVLHARGLKFGIADVFVSAAKLFNLENRKSLPAVFNYPSYIRQHRDQLHEIFNISEKVFVLSKWFREILLANGFHASGIRLVRQALPQALTESSPARDLSKESVRLVYVGRITAIKGLHVVLQAMAQLKNATVSLDIYGPVTEDGYVNDCKKLCGSLATIQWRGTVPPRDIVQRLANYDALILPSVVEEMAPLIIQEAFAAGIPVIGSDCLGIAEEVTIGRNGFLFKRGDHTALSKLLQDLAQSPRLLKDLRNNVTPPRTFDTVAADTYSEYITSNSLQTAS